MKCKNCNKNDGIKYSKYASGDFCCKSCARCFSTKEKRVEINTKVSKILASRYIKKVKIKEKVPKNISTKTCISCGCQIEQKDTYKIYCIDCKQFVYNKKLFEKLGIKESNLKTANVLAITKLKTLYFEEKKSTIDILKEYKIRDNTTIFFFRKNGIPLRNLSKSAKNSYAQGKGNQINPHNGSVYTTKWHTTWYGKKVFLRSSYEIKFAEHLDRKKIYYEVSEKRIPYIFENEEHTYIPDFYIPDLCILVETKSGYFYKTEKNEIDAKIKASETAGYKILLLVDKDVDKYIEENAT